MPWGFTVRVEGRTLITAIHPGVSPEEWMVGHQSQLLTMGFHLNSGR